ncbi:MAG: ADP-ribosylglycohydrolase family protein [Bacteroides sp.]|nr:ADP-ribosylglycohydrolase family protein [Bacteroidales bacterium]MCM1068716.1 ADP-ribosylglycohydrolase family protein [Prevotella sp.]MCM1354684.1 ADP-ribosylglycohydrolase family protein [Bacteroides sp.]MCM1403768.1 ADP-ribosylglycohydrolase family protein [Bacteroides sp.]MCM1443514.1 ADP-ribosylglycohydrolase family protein [Muribaculum sp.]
MLGAIFGDIAGSVYEFNPTTRYDFPLITKQSTFTDDTICTIAIADAYINGAPYDVYLLHWCSKYPNPMGGYGGSFQRWLQEADAPAYFSWGNGSAMRVSSLGWLCQSENEVLEEATYSAACTHNHPDGIRGAQATALAVFLARRGVSKEEILERIEHTFGYSIVNGSLEDYRGRFDESCNGTVPAAFLCIRDSHDYESAIRLAVSLAADADTLGAIVGGIAEALYGMPADLQEAALGLLPAEIKKVYQQFKREIEV